MSKQELDLNKSMMRDLLKKKQGLSHRANSQSNFNGRNQSPTNSNNKYREELLSVFGDKVSQRS